MFFFPYVSIYDPIYLSIYLSQLSHPTRQAKNLYPFPPTKLITLRKKPTPPYIYIYQFNHIYLSQSDHMYLFIYIYIYICFYE